MGYIGLTAKVDVYQLTKGRKAMPVMDYSKLRGRIKECGYTQKSLAGGIGISEGQFCQKLTGKYPFTQKEIDKICDVLKISVNEIGLFFFSPES